jgi:hypothetical protein
MTQEEKSLLLKDLCARLPYGVIVETYWEFENKKEKTFPKTILTHGMLGYYIGEDKWKYNTHFLPFLHPMSSMTGEEDREYINIDNRSYSCPIDYAHIPASDRIDWLNAHHFDYRGLIEKGLAIEVTEENNPYKE